MNRLQVGLLLLALLVGCSAPDLPKEPQSQDLSRSWSGPYKVLKVRDGDSIRVQDGRKTREVRLFGIDAPEHDQPGADEAKKHARQLMSGRSVWLSITTTDRYDRSVAWVAVEREGLSINAKMVAGGMAWVYRQYTQDQQLIALEDQARAAKKGLWSRPAAQRIPPWQWRKRRAN